MVPEGGSIARVEASARAISRAVGRFLGGFLVASLLWGGGVAAYEAGYLDEYLPEEDVEADLLAERDEPDGEEVVQEDAPRRRRRRGRPRGGMSAMEAADYPRGEATTGEDLGSDDPRELSAGESGGEAQLSSAQVESGFDTAFGGIQRCLVLVPSEAPLRGRLTFGLRIAGSGRVTRVNLQGPAAVTSGDSGDCLRTAARRIHFPSFDGPEMIVHYPITLE